MKVFCIVGPAKSGKTLLIERLIPELNRRGLRVAAVKHTHHRHVSLDIPGKDTYRYRQAGAEIIVLASPDGFSILTEEDGTFGLEEVVQEIRGEGQLPAGAQGAPQVGQVLAAQEAPAAMAGLSLGVATLSFVLGYIIRTVLGVEV